MSEINRPAPTNLRLAAALIGGTALLEVVLVTHHPVVSRVEHDSGLAFDALAAIVQANLAFHAVLMLVAVGQLAGLFLFARRLGLDRPLVLTGSLLCSLATMLIVTAMTFDGFVVYELVSRCSMSAGGCSADVTGALQLVSAIIQGFTKLGFGAQCIGFAALGLASWSLGGKARIGSVLSVMAATAPLAILTSGSYVGPEQLTQILGLLGGWGLCMAIILVAATLPSAGRSFGDNA
ncbi:hypothetical protein [Brevundimonas sp.]|uniref:hypothetical protein n=1 Tax=Brevundimonas sp. TaxID=1871086 RepID=UPI00286D45D0|nr:hypothetical protein [Brevundimonas sp.]